MSHFCKVHEVIYEGECLECVREQRDDLLSAARVAFAYVDAIVDHAELWGRPADEDTKEVHRLLGAAIARAKGES